MKKRIISMLLAGMMVLNSAVVYADADMTGDYTTYAEENNLACWRQDETSENVSNRSSPCHTVFTAQLPGG